eukprot:9379697-Lingulodinium_polyedra.AAC.1
MGIDIAGTALDWQNAFDHIPVASVLLMPTRAGVPRRLAGPVCSIYSSQRRARVEGTLGAPWQP